VTNPVSLPADVGASAGVGQICRCPVAGRR